MNANAKTLIHLPEQRVTREGDAVRLPAVAGDVSQIMTVIAAAARDPNVDADKMLKLYELRDRELARCARAAFAEAMADFKKNPPKIVKDKHVAIPHKNGSGTTEYDHATLGHVCDQIVAGLAVVGISHKWDLAQSDGGMVRVTCVLTHADGHSEGTALQAGRDDSGSKNNIQAIGSTVTYLQRYTLLAATGLAAGLPDDDGAGSEPNNCITDSQVADLNALLTEVGASKDALLSWLKLTRLADIPADRFAAVVRAVEGKRKTPAKPAGQVRR